MKSSEYDGYKKLDMENNKKMHIYTPASIFTLIHKLVWKERKGVHDPNVI